MVAVFKTFAVLGVCALLLASCVPAGSSDLNLDGLQAQGTLAAVYALQTSTAQAQSDMALQATIQAGQTESALHYTQEAHSATQAAEYQATQFSAAQTAQVEQTRAAQATETAQSAATQTAWTITQTPLAATQAAIVRADEQAEREAYWRQFTTPLKVILPVLLLFVVMGLLIAAGVKAFPYLLSTLQALELRLRTRYGPDGEALLLLDKSQSVHTVLPGRALGHAVRNTAAEVQVDATPAGPEWQDRVTGREQAVRLAHALPREQRKAAQKLLAQPENLPAGRPQVIVLPAEDPRIRPLLDEVETKLLEEGGTSHV